MRETWYVLQDGTTVPPSEVSMNGDGKLAHKNGLVAMRDDGETPRSRGVDVDDGGKPLFGGKGDHDGNGKSGGTAPPIAPTPPTSPVPRADTQMKPADKPEAKKPGYKTRKAR